MYNINKTPSNGYAVVIRRQSGNIHAEYTATTLDAAMNVVNRSMNRTGRQAFIQTDSYDRLVFQLPYNGRGSQEGKKVGSYEVIALNNRSYEQVQQERHSNEKVTEFFMVAGSLLTFLLIALVLG
ncbi:hypothetical protein JKP10_21315 [Vibrio vulnificus]|uniref:hypothetical protein n=1 Tax=Vibrio vulnificus TaxID=672 RepID=UPI001CDC8AB8|nr:hypothetical protein [Vibrio vulnificus]MCA4002039.1 hypothetical protein [Vibrio vulnificus]MCA4010921.1 hypothetical protein [Vibrio vulnificus]MDK2609349.1 hypothetical protein [Vibrio vulnificus]MDK2612492.1 hypothetical protein [Vibrio vulnificus]MDK2628267.1 hypothetical protein [Vibrio vulnificus]